MDISAANKLDIFTAARNAIAMEMAAMASPGVSAAANKPVLYAPNGNVIPLQPDSYYNYRRAAAKRTGSMKNWIPKRQFSRQQEAREREEIVARSIELTNDDPHAAGVVDTFATTIAGAGLHPIPSIDPDGLNLQKDQVYALQAKQRRVYHKWYKTADAAGAMTFGQMQYLLIRSLCEYGEYVVLIHMIERPNKHYMLSCRVINPLRLKTPVDMINNPFLKDGIELGAFSEPVAYWIKKSSGHASGAQLPDTSQNFLRIPAFTGHRPNVIHRFVSREPEQLRGMPILAPAMKFFRDLNDYLDTELVSNIIASAISIFIELSPGQDPLGVANNLSNFNETDYNAAGQAQDVRYQELSACCPNHQYKLC